MSDPWAGKGPCGICGMPVPLGTVLCPVCGETNDKPVEPRQPERVGRCRVCGMPAPVGTVVCDVCGETNDPPVEEDRPEPEFRCPHCGMSISRSSAELSHTCPVCGENPFEPLVADPVPGHDGKEVDPIDHLPGDAPEPPVQPLRPEEQGIVDETLTGLANAGVDAGSSYTVTDARIDGDGNTRVEVTIAVGPDGQPLPPIAGRQGHPGAVALLVIEATATHKHARLVAVDTNRIYKSSSAWTNTGAFTELVDGGRFVLPKSRRPGKVIAVVTGILVIAGVGVVLLLSGGGDDDTTVAQTASGTTAPDDSAADGPASGDVSTNPDDLAQAVLPSDGLPWVAFKHEDFVPPPDPIQPLPRGHRFQGTFTITAQCDGDTCTYSTPMDTGAAIVVGTLPDVAWERRGADWYLDSVADVQSSNTGGLQCVLHRAMSWNFTPTEATWDGSQWVMSAGEGGMFYEVNLDQALSAAAIAEGYCPPYSEVSGWDASVATDAAALPTTPP